MVLPHVTLSSFLAVFPQLLSCFSPLQGPTSGSPGFTGGQFSEAGPSADNKMALTDFGSFRPAVRDRPSPQVLLMSGKRVITRHSTGGHIGSEMIIFVYLNRYHFKNITNQQLTNGQT